MKIVTLIENYVSEEGLFAEHGLSFYIETDKQNSIRHWANRVIYSKCQETRNEYK